MHSGKDGEHSRTITKIRSVWRRLSERQYRDEYAAQKVYSAVAAQIYALREHRGWTQKELAERAGMKQPRISSLERTCEGVSITTLARLAAAFDVALSVKFVPYSHMVEEGVSERLDRPVTSFDGDRPPSGTKTIHQQIRTEPHFAFRARINASSESTAMPAHNASKTILEHFHA